MSEVARRPAHRHPGSSPVDVWRCQARRAIRAGSSKPVTSTTHKDRCRSADRRIKRMIESSRAECNPTHELGNLDGLRHHGFTPAAGVRLRGMRRQVNEPGVQDNELMSQLWDKHSLKVVRKDLVVSEPLDHPHKRRVDVVRTITGDDVKPSRYRRRRPSAVYRWKSVGSRCSGCRNQRVRTVFRRSTDARTPRVLRRGC